MTRNNWTFNIMGSFWDKWQQSLYLPDNNLPFQQWENASDPMYRCILELDAPQTRNYLQQSAKYNKRKEQ